MDIVTADAVQTAAQLGLEGVTELRRSPHRTEQVRGRSSGCAGRRVPGGGLSPR